MQGEFYTFTNQGVFVYQTTFMGPNGITLDSDSGFNGYNWLGIIADITDAAFDDTASPTIYYGNGENESTASADFEFDDRFGRYVVLPGNGSDTYQDAIVGIARGGWLDDTGGGYEIDEWRWDERSAGMGALIGPHFHRRPFCPRAKPQRSRNFALKLVLLTYGRGRSRYRGRTRSHCQQH